MRRLFSAFVAAIIAMLFVGVGVWYLTRDTRTWWTNTIGVLAFVGAGFVAFRFRATGQHRDAEPEPSATVSADNTVREAVDLPAQIAALMHQVKALQKAIDALTDEVAASRKEPPQHIRTLQQAIDRLSANILQEAARRTAEPPVVPVTTSRIPLREETADRSPSYDEAITQDVHDRLRQLAVKCMSRGWNMRRMRDELPSDWRIDPMDPVDTPDAFFVYPSASDHAWVVPNTREWLPFRERGWFDVSGSDVVSARITSILRLPRLGRSRHVVQRGSVEVGF